MPIIQGPLFSLSASGTIHDSLTYQKSRVRKVARSKPTPTGPRTPAQVDSHSIIKWLNELWRLQATILKFTWNLNVGPRGITGYNTFISENMAALSAGTLLENLHGSGDKGQGLAMTEVSLSRFGAGATLDSASFPVPPGWVLVFRIGIAMHNLDPRTTPPTQSNFGLSSSLTGAYKVNMVDNTPPLVATQYIWWRKPDFSNVISRSVTTTIA